MSSHDKVKDVLTTGEVAKICNVAPRTVSKWFDSGALHGYRIPGSKDRRIPLNQLIRFMKQHGMPLNGLMTGCTRILIVDDEQDIVEVLEKILEDEAKYEVEVAKGGFAAGVTAEKFRPHVILLDMHLRDIDGREVAKQVKSNPDLQLTKVIAMSGKMTEEETQGPAGQRLRRLPQEAVPCPPGDRSRSKTRWRSCTRNNRIEDFDIIPKGRPDPIAGGLSHSFKTNTNPPARSLPSVSSYREPGPRSFLVIIFIEAEAVRERVFDSPDHPRRIVSDAGVRQLPNLHSSIAPHVYVIFRS